MDVRAELSGTGAVDRWNTSDTTANRDFADVFAAHHRSILRLAALLCGNAHMAEEVTAEVFARVLPRWRRGAVDEPLQYLRRACVNEVRSRHRRRAVERRAMERYRARPRTDDTTWAAGLAEPLVAALLALPVRQRAVVVLRFHDDLSEVDVARTLGITVGTVKTHASRGLERLRCLLEEER